MTTWHLLAPLWFAEVIVLGETCSDHGCAAVATVDIAWPSRGWSPKCGAGARAWGRVADAMGFFLPVRDRQVSVVDPPPVDDAAVRFSMMELER